MYQNYNLYTIQGLYYAITQNNNNNNYNRISIFIYNEDINQRKYELPKGSTTHMDVYKIECSQPLLLNFYYVDESAKIPDLSYGQVVIYTLKPNSINSGSFQSYKRPFYHG